MIRPVKYSVNVVLVPPLTPANENRIAPAFWVASVLLVPVIESRKRRSVNETPYSLAIVRDSSTPGMLARLMTASIVKALLLKAALCATVKPSGGVSDAVNRAAPPLEIGRASCRE